MGFRLSLIFLLIISSSTNACLDSSYEQLIVNANRLVSEKIESDSELSSQLFPLFNASNHSYSQLKLITSIYQPRVGFEVIDCDPKSETQKLKILWFRPEIKIKAWVFKQNAMRNQLLSQVEINYEDVDLIKFKATKEALAVGPFDENIWISEAVKINTPILKKNLKVAPMVARNQLVKVVVVADNVVIETKGVAQQFGQYLEKVSVRLPTNNQLIRATVIKEGTVRID
ncbi:flagella basal body P-ring formation protein FlgA [Acinetobacter oleivorans]|uniref:flagella basal body P-ring formation protein FlgA n=1 Tax=Acinetobacter oleivorans TaxID=1148157 RepID=UPI001250287C|nr:flagella basal body P-ring formation protein FlgA [Acinetobacter oleivorans]